MKWLLLINVALTAVGLWKVNQMATRDDLNAGLDAEGAAITKTLTDLHTSITDLQAKVDAGTVVTPEDFSAELAKVSAQTAAILAGDTATPATPVAVPDPSTPASGTPATS